MIQDYWKRWRLEYLTSLQARQRWVTPATPIKCGTIVLLELPNSPPLRWPLGIIIETFPGKDGQVRVVSVKTKSGTYKRPVVKLPRYPIKTSKFAHPVHGKAAIFDRELGWKSGKKVDPNRLEATNIEFTKNKTIILHKEL
ncbi:hypothetical protein NQ318_022692 [Aromia moschata]|uniref:DUF5641 domain-containing protein n=1 Tax=Aromia moschata TaxID=1265417 RepID=A0AAV8YD41_9CUCU|nr:hypothetical protein NQ318_022692 [Aromia moschata]